MAYQKRSESWSDRKDSGATLRNPDRSVTVQVKLKWDGRIEISLVRDEKFFHRELSPELNWDD